MRTDFFSLLDRSTFRSSRRTSSAFTLIEVVIVMLMLSTLGLGIANYLGKQREQLSDSDMKSSLTSSSSLVSKTLARDIKQAVFLNPSCDDTSGVAADCDQLIIRGGIVPLPSLTRSAVTALGNYELPGNLESVPANLGDNDAIRILVFDFEQEFDCPLDIDEANNPDSGTPSIYVEDDCEASLSAVDQGVGQLYILVGVIGDTIYSNLFQLTGHLDGPSANYEIQYQTAGGTNLFNQTPTLAASGFPNSSRIFPVKLIEYALEDTDNTLYRREINPGNGDMAGLGAWVAVQNNIENLQFWPLTLEAGTGAVVEHQRSMQFNTAVPPDPGNDGVEDIRGVSPRMVIRSSNEYASEAVDIDNPITSTVESDGFDRKEVKFYVSLINYQE